MVFRVQVRHQGYNVIERGIARRGSLHLLRQQIFRRSCAHQKAKVRSSLYTRVPKLAQQNQSALMPPLRPLCRACGLSSRAAAGPSRLPLSRLFSALSPRQPESTPFFSPPYRPSPPSSYSRKGKERAVEGRRGDEEDPELEVSDKEWEMRVGALPPVPKFHL